MSTSQRPGIAISATPSSTAARPLPPIAARVRAVAVSSASSRQATAVTSRIAVTGSSATSTNPVTNVPIREPMVPAAESCPTTAPEPSTLRSRARVTAGVTMASAVTGDQRGRADQQHRRDRSGTDQRAEQPHQRAHRQHPQPTRPAAPR